MLTEIYIKNYTIVDELHLSLNPGLSILSGETGAGKSIVVDSVSLALGARKDTKAIRHGHHQCEITLCFDLTHTLAGKKWLIEHDFLIQEDENECIIARTITQEGRSRASINGKPAPLALIRELANKLLIIHSQHESQNLLQQEQQRDYLDQFGRHSGLLQQLLVLYSSWQKNENQLTQLKSEAENRLDQLALLNYQLEELQALNLKENEWHNLHLKHQTLHQTNALITHVSRALELTAENERANTIAFLHQAIEELSTIKLPEKEITSALEMLANAMIHLQEANDELTHYRNSLDLSPEKLEMIEKRLTLIHDLARKHHVTPEELPFVLKSIQQKIERLQSLENLIETLSIKQTNLLLEYQQTAQVLSEKRSQIAKEISAKITTYMQHLGMQGGEFKISLESNSDKINAKGFEKIQFLVKTNPGQLLQPLTKVVSGGELSRISLALQAIIAEKDNTTTFIFDEVDTGIGGKTAEIVGQLLHTLSAQSQVFCITHLAQVAAQGDHHYQVSKSSTNNTTTASITLLSRKDRILELARMLSGSKMTKQTLLHAEELLHS